MRIVVTGASGYLGAKVVQALSKNSENELYSLQHKNTTTEKCEKVFLSYDEMKEYFIENRIKIDLILYMACLYAKKDNLNEVVAANLTLPLQLLSFAAEFSIENYLYIGTSLPKEVNSYAYTKHTLAEYGKMYSQEKNINFIHICPEIFYGRDEPSNRFVKNCISKLQNNEDLLLTKGTQKRDFIPVEEVVHAIVEITNKKLAGYHEIPVGTGQAVSIQEMICYLKELLQSESKLLFGAIESRKTEPDCVADIEAMKKYGISTTHNWKIGFQKIVEAIK